MGTLLFIVLHTLAALFGAVLLFVTIPAHLIYLAVRNRGEPKPNAATHRKCPDCRELVLHDARVCKHCGCRLIPSK